MNAETGNVLGSLSPVTKEQAKNAVAQAFQRLVGKHGKERLARALGCEKRTVENALAHKSLLEAHFLVNALDVDPTALNELLFLKGLHAVPLTAALSPHMQTVNMLSRALATYLSALADGKVIHTEKLEIADELRPLIPLLTALVHEADGLRRVA